jgi:hypothetical protein
VIELALVDDAETTRHVTLAAGRRHLAFVRVTVAARTVAMRDRLEDRKRLTGIVVAQPQSFDEVTRVAFDVSVLPRERIVRLLMIELGCFVPRGGVVARFARQVEFAVMRIILAMTGDARRLEPHPSGARFSRR